MGRAVSRHVYLNGCKNNIVGYNYFDQFVGSPSPATVIYADNSANQLNKIDNNTFIGTGNGWTYAYYEAGGIGSPGNTWGGGNRTNGLRVQTFSAKSSSGWTNVADYGGKGDGT